MDNTLRFEKKKVIKYLIWTFALAWCIQIGVAVLTYHVDRTIGQLATAAMMLVPALGVLLAGGSLRQMGWKPRIRRNIKYILLAWLLPALLTALGAILFFMVFPRFFDLSGAYLKENVGADAMEQLSAKGLTYPLYLLISTVCSLTYAPFLNTALALGEELGWRGFLYPQLKARFGTAGGRLLGGVIWGAWHWPLIWLIGYEYGTCYLGFPVVGMLVFCVFTVACGVLCDWLYEKSGSIWLPSLCHGAVNAVAALPLMLCAADTGSAILLGPVPNGLIAGLPMIILSLILLKAGAEPVDTEGTI